MTSTGTMEPMLSSVQPCVVTSAPDENDVTTIPEVVRTLFAS